MKFPSLNEIAMDKQKIRRETSIINLRIKLLKLYKHRFVRLTKIVELLKL